MNKDYLDQHHAAANTIRGLAMDAVQKANSGHPGMPMGMADTAVVLWTQFLKHNPQDPHWFDRDRFVPFGRPWVYAVVQPAASSRLCR